MAAFFSANFAKTMRFLADSALLSNKHDVIVRLTERPHAASGPEFHSCESGHRGRLVMPPDIPQNGKTQSPQLSAYTSLHSLVTEWTRITQIVYHIAIHTRTEKLWKYSNLRACSSFRLLFGQTDDNDASKSSFNLLCVTFFSEKKKHDKEQTKQFLRLEGLYTELNAISRADR